MMNFVDRDVRNQMTVANKIGMPANGYRVVDTSAEDPDEGLFDYPTEESRAIGQLADEFAALADLGLEARAREALNESFTMMIEGIRAAHTDDELDNACERFGYLGKLKGVQEFISVRRKAINQ
jgi:hypothetical protein